jgi:endonuclease/exonuclease/phosphatase family metal-dependent hydrolase
MNKLLTFAVKTAFVSTNALCLAACGWTLSSRNNARVMSGTVPQTTHIQTLTVQMSGNTQGIQGVLISSTTPQHEAHLSDSFFALAVNNRQVIGTILSNKQMPSEFQAKTSSGELISCTSVKRPSFADLNATQFQIQCGQNQLSIELSTVALNIKNLDFLRAQKSLVHGALVALHSENRLAEIQLKSDVLHVSRGGNNKQFRIKDFDEQLIHNTQNNFVVTGDEVCQSDTCGLLKERAELTVNDDQLTLKIFTPEENSIENYSTTTSEKLSISSYNVENFWDDDPNNSSPYSDFSSLNSNWYLGKFPQKKAERIKTALLAAGLPDVVGLQEIESANNKSRSLELLKPLLSELGYNYYALGLQADDNPTAVTTAVISKHPIIENKRIDFVFSPDSLPEDQKYDFIGSSRDPQHATIVLPEGHSFVLLNSHWKSKRDKSPLGDDMRLSVAKRIKEHSDGLKFENGSAVPVVIVGDFNADYREEPVQAGLQLASSLSSARSAGLLRQLVPLWLTLPEAEQGSYPHDSHLQALDNIVVTASFLQGQKISLSGPMKVAGRSGLSAHMLANADGQPLRSQIVKYKDSQGEIHARHFDLGYSDHFPLVVMFNRNGQRSSHLFPTEIEKQSSQNLPYVLIQGSECGSLETISLTTELLDSAQYGQCVSLSGNQLTLEKTGLYNIYFNAAGAGLSEKSTKIIITADRAYGANKQWLRGTLQNSKGKTLTKLKGRIGLVEGQKAIFIHSPTEDIEIK